MKKLTNWLPPSETATPDTAAHIVLSAMCGASSCHLHVIELPPGAKEQAHLHYRGDEILIVQRGSGCLYTGKYGFVHGELAWLDAIDVTAGDTFIIPAVEVHQLHNTGDENLVFLLVCPESHLETDRMVVADYFDCTVQEPTAEESLAL